MSVRFSGVLCALTLAACGVAAPPPPVAATGPARYVAVHIDNLAPDKAAQFEAARRAWVAQMAKAGVSDSRGTFLQTDANRFYTLRPFTRFAELDTRADKVARALEPLPREARAAYDKASDEALVYPHSSEIWEVDDDLGFAPEAGALTLADAGVGLLVIEELRPDPVSEARYAAAWSQAKMALGSSSFPLTRVTYRSAFGSGRVVSMWLARTKDDLERARPERWLARALGDAGAADLQSAVAATVLHEERVTFVVRHDLSTF